MAGRFLYLKNTPSDPPSFTDGLGDMRFDVAQQYVLEQSDLAAYDALVLTMHSDQRHLMENSDRLGRYLNNGGAIVFNGHVAQSFLPVLSPFRPVTGTGIESLRIHREADHPLFQDVTSDHLSFQRGVAGFYGRGTNPPPPGALVLNSVGPDREPVDWLVERPGGGRLLVHAGNDLFVFLARAEPDGLSYLKRFFAYFSGG
jgi:hypothetical protein